MENTSLGFKRMVRAVIPAFLLAVSVGQIYAFTNFATEIRDYLASQYIAQEVFNHLDELKIAMSELMAKVQFAFSLGIFFLGMGAAFFGKIVERNIRLSTIIGTTLFISGLLVTALGVKMKSLALIYLGYGFLVGTGTGIIYISPVKTMMLWFPNAKAIAAAVPIISFGLGSTLSTLLYKGFSFGGPDAMFAMAFRGFYDFFGVAKETWKIQYVFLAFAVFYLVPMAVSAFILKKPKVEQMSFAHGLPQCEFTYLGLAKDTYFLRAWLFMFLNISCGLCLIPLAKQMMDTPAVAYPENLTKWVIALCGIMNGGGRFLFAWWSDRLAHRVNILLFILGISAGVMTASWWPPLIGLALLVINACYGAGFSVIPGILADHYGMTNISKIHGAVLSAWGVAGLVGNQAAILVSDKLGFGHTGVVTMLVVLYLLNFVNALSLCRSRLSEGAV
jgi:OFA family oxalate/formate antiporter-like MFS transporter